MKLKQGDNVWFPHEEHSWLAASITKISDDGTELSCPETGPLKCSAKQLHALDLCGSHVKEDVANLVDLDELSEGAILHHTRKRFARGLIYTHVGAILVAVNPFERLPIYGEDVMRKAQDTSNVFPHVFMTAAVAYAQVQMNLKNQSVLISGESGAGKTETTKKVLTYLATVAPGKAASDSEPGIEDQILQSNPLLEALGNAKTLRNNNSSRFGKYMKVDLDNSFRIQGCEIINYLLEKSRVTAQSTMERNYHIFYQLIMGVDDAYPGFTDKWGKFLPFEQYNFLNQSGCVQIEGVDDKKDFDEVVEALRILQFTPELQDQMMRIITAVLLMGNVMFTTGSSEGSSEVESGSSQDLVAKIDKLLGFDAAAFHFALTMKRVQMGRGSVVSIKLTPEQALDSKDTLAKALYSNMFDWIIYSVNQTLKTSEALYSVGILDIFGFEVFDINSFEQLCINYANEKLQLHFNEVIFNEEMKMYNEEGIPSEHIDFVDNALCVALIESRPTGLLCLLDEECSLGKATDLTYANKITQAFAQSNPKTGNVFFEKNKTKPEAFTVKHFAGPVEYIVTNFLEKNKDTLSQTLREVAAMSTLSLVADLFPIEQASTGRGRKTSAKATLGGQFRNQLIGLINNLNSTEPHFIRCVKPNHAKKPKIFDGVLSLRQLRYAGLFEAIRIRQSGFAFRVTHKVFAQTYYTLVDGLQKKMQSNEVSHKEAATIILENASSCGYLDKKLWIVGNTRVFIKTNQDRIQLERQRSLRVEVYTIRLQKIGRGFLARARVHKAKFEAARAEQRRLMENDLFRVSALLLQRVVRGYLVRKAMRLMQDFVRLRKAMANRDVEAVEATLLRIDGHDEDSLMAFEDEVKTAKTMVKLIQIQDKYIADLNKAILTENVTDLNRLLVKCDRLDLDAHPSVQQAKELIEVLHEKRNVMQDMVDFLKNDNNADAMESVPEMLLHAEAIGVDSDFIDKVKRCYENTSPRLRARGKLRRAIEIIDKEAVLEAVQEIDMLQLHHEPFATMELKAAKGLLQMLELEACLAPKSLANFEETYRFTDACLNLCHEICACQDSDKLKSLVKTLKIKHAYGSASKYESILRSYKWSKVFCTWKYPEVLDKDRVRSPEQVAMEEAESFFGLRPSAARQSTHIILSLHQDMDRGASKNGLAPASLQAAMGALNMLADHNSPDANEKLRSLNKRKTSTPGITTTSYKSGRHGDGASPRKEATPMFKKKNAAANAAGRRTTYYFLPPKVENQLLESRKLLKIQQKNIGKIRRRDDKEKVKNWK